MGDGFTGTGLPSLCFPGLGPSGPPQGWPIGVPLILSLYLWMAYFVMTRSHRNGGVRLPREGCVTTPITTYVHMPHVLPQLTKKA
ncbi:hypothetical protein SBV1_3150006 [Verrucomicrobia bacterium]|nr:hypothetical protein SBV1_3150006 [Verrucomicrobiota bacterium]